MSTVAPVLLFAYGNPDRGDDALGPLLLEQLQERLSAHADIDFLTDFQLQIEHALDLQGRELVLFMDASVNCSEPFDFKPIQARNDNSFTTHAMSPCAVLQVFLNIIKQLPPPCFLLSIRGHSFELGDGLSDQATYAARLALAFAVELCEHANLDDWMSKVT